MSLKYAQRRMDQVFIMSKVPIIALGVWINKFPCSDIGEYEAGYCFTRSKSKDGSQAGCHYAHIHTHTCSAREFTFSWFVFLCRPMCVFLVCLGFWCNMPNWTIKMFWILISIYYQKQIKKDIIVMDARNLDDITRVLSFTQCLSQVGCHTK